MVRPRRAAAVLTLILAGFAGVPASAQVQAEQIGAATAGVAEGSSIVQQINAARRAHGLRPLAIAKGLRQAAVAHARSMGRYGYFSHSSANGTGATQRIRSFYSGLTVGEAILWRSPTVSPGQAVDMWLGSPPHRALLLSRAFREVGVGVVVVSSAPGTYDGLDVAIVVADFGAR
jgi:uncharacterized protein YkwD